MATLKELEVLVGNYAAARSVLRDHVEQLQTRMSELRRQWAPVLRAGVAEVAGLSDSVRAAILDSPEVFEGRKTITIDGIRVGWMKQKGQVVIDDEAAVIARIRKLLPTEQAELLIRVREAVHKPAVYDLTASDLKRLGITVTDAEDAVIIKAVDSEVDKLVAALLAEAEKVEEAA